MACTNISTQRPCHWRLNCPIGCRFPDETLTSSCSENGFPDIPHLREHLVDKHGPRCSKQCKIVGESDADWIQHRDACKLAKQKHRLTQKQATMLNSLPRRSPRTTTVRKQWESIFAIIFPDEPFPAPFIPSAEQVRQVARSPPPELVKLLAEQLEDPDLEAARTKSGFVEMALQKVVPNLIEQLRRTGHGKTLLAVPPPPSPETSLDRSIPAYVEVVDTIAAPEGEYVDFASHINWDAAGYPETQWHT